MSNMFDGVAPIVKREMVLFFFIDVSGSMSGTKIGAVNTAIREVLPEIRSVGGSDALIRIACLRFSSGWEWMHPSPVAADDFQWMPVSAGGMTEFGAACEELARKMSREFFLKAPSASVAPAIFLMSDGQPTDSYKIGLEKLWKNRWFQHAIKVAVAIGDDADTSVLEEFTGSSEAVLRVHTPEALKKMIRFVSVTSSKVGSQSMAAGNGAPMQTKQQAVEQQIADFVEEEQELFDKADDWD